MKTKYRVQTSYVRRRATRWIEVAPSVVSVDHVWSHVSAIKWIRTKTTMWGVGTYRILRQTVENGPWVVHRMYRMQSNGIVKPMAEAHCEEARVAKSAKVIFSGPRCDCESDDVGSYAARLSRLRHALIEQDGLTWEVACERLPDGAHLDCS
jgi:hypothetical protein